MKRAAFLLLVATAFLLAGCATTNTPTRVPIRLPTPQAVELPTVAWTRAPTPTRPRVTLSPPTPTPTWTPTPKPLPYGWVKAYRARLRAAPSLDAEVIALVPAGTTLRLLGRSEDGDWYRVRTEPLNGEPQEGWMAAEVVATFARPEDIP